MKKILTLIIVMIVVTLPVIANESSNYSSTRRVSLEVCQTKEPATTAHRAPMRINIEAWYNAESNTIDISYDGEDEGEVFLYLNESIIEYDSKINTSFQIPTFSGLYKIEVYTSSWLAEGYISI